MTLNPGDTLMAGECNDIDSLYTLVQKQFQFTEREMNLIVRNLNTLEGLIRDNSDKNRRDLDAFSDKITHEFDLKTESLNNRISANDVQIGVLSEKIHTVEKKNEANTKNKISWVAIFISAIAVLYNIFKGV